MKKKHKKERNKVVAVKSKSMTGIERLSMKKKMARKKKERKLKKKQKLRRTRENETEIEINTKGNNWRNSRKRFVVKGKKVPYLRKQNKKK